MNTEFNISESNFCQETYNLVHSEYQIVDREISNKDSKFKNNFLSPQTLQFFRSIGGKETVSQGSKFGLGCTISESISPDKMTKKLTYFFY
jgi:hypothetical protein